jgi:low temperature requirement protein LtrA
MVLKDFRRRFWLPPRAHGEVIEDRTVSFLELFYDLVYVVVIAAAASVLSHDITWRTTAEFAVVFALIWLAWVNGTLYHDLHGHDDIRTRTYTFAQMLLVVLLAVFVGDGPEGGQSFALVYAAFFALLTWLWYTVRRQDDERYRATTARYLMANITFTLVMFGSAFLEADAQLAVWALLLVGWLIGNLVLGRSMTTISEERLFVSGSFVERFGLFIIIVLGEVVVGVVDGLSHAERNVETIATGLVALTIGFGFWWNYFDLTGRRLPREDPGGAPFWLTAQLPLTMSIAAAGAAMVGVIEHATDDRAPQAATWLLSGSVALGFLALIAIVRTLEDYDRYRAVYLPTSFVMLGAAGLALLIGAWRPAPLLLVTALAATQALVWVFAVGRWLGMRAEAGRTG